MTESLQGDRLYGLHRCVGKEYKIVFTKDPDGDLGWPKAEAARRKKGAASVSANEYDFSNVPPDELLDCIHYEYARESARIVTAVEALRSYLYELKAKGKIIGGERLTIPIIVRKFTNSFVQGYDRAFLLALTGQPHFPRLAWMDLTERQTLKNFHSEAVGEHNLEFLSQYPVLIADVVQDNPRLPALTLESWETKTLPASFQNVPEALRRRAILSGFMMVNLLHSPELIVEEFKKWLLKRHPRANRPVPEKRGRKSPKDKLNALGAMRLRFYCRTLQEAQKTIAPLQQANGMAYSDRTAWNRACKSASKHFLEVLDLPEGDLPIHFTAGW